MLAKNFVRLIAFDPLGAQVPAAHKTPRIQHVNGVVSDALDQNPEPFFAASQRLFSAFPFR
jgi:hypothetical protein